MSGMSETVASQTHKTYVNKKKSFTDWRQVLKKYQKEK